MKNNKYLVKYILISALYILHVSCSNTRKITIEDCKKQTENILVSIKKGDYKTLLSIINSDDIIKNRKITEEELQLHFKSLNIYLEKYEINDFTILDRKEITNNNLIFNLNLGVKNKKSEMEILECIYGYGRNGELYELKEFNNKLDSFRIKVNTIPPPQK